MNSGCEYLWVIPVYGFLYMAYTQGDIPEDRWNEAHSLIRVGPIISDFPVYSLLELSSGIRLGKLHA
jgi:hypothetical protein